MDRYIGLDAHIASCTFAVMTKTGKRVLEQHVETHGKSLQQFIKGIAGSKHLILEEGELSEWIYEMLRPLVSEFVIIQPIKASKPKSDLIDAWNMANMLRKGDVEKPVFKAPGVYSALRQAVRAHSIAVQDLVRTKNKVKAFFRGRGIQASGKRIYCQKERYDYLEKLPIHHRRCAELFYELLDGQTQIVEKAEKWLVQEAKRLPVVKILETAPGIGTIRAAQIVATVISPHRFRTKRQLWSYSGLAIVTTASSERIWDEKKGWIRKKVPLSRGLNRNRNAMLKNVFKGAATTVVTRMPDQPLHQAYQRIIKNGTRPNLAKLTIARRIAAIVLTMFKNQESYDPEKQRRQKSE